MQDGLNGQPTRGRRMQFFDAAVGGILGLEFHWIFPSHTFSDEFERDLFQRIPIKETFASVVGMLFVVTREFALSYSSFLNYA
jgi:hypothetical protein